MAESGNIPLDLISHSCGGASIHTRLEDGRTICIRTVTPKDEDRLRAGPQAGGAGAEVGPHRRRVGARGVGRRGPAVNLVGARTGADRGSTSARRPPR